MSNFELSHIKGCFISDVTAEFVEKVLDRYDIENVVIEPTGSNGLRWVHFKLYRVPGHEPILAKDSLILQQVKSTDQVRLNFYTEWIYLDVLIL